MRKPQNFQWKEMTMGTCYYPEHWSRELWQDDLQRMKAVGITVIRVAEFAWNKVEPEEGVYDFTWLDEIMDKMAENGITAPVYDEETAKVIFERIENQHLARFDEVLAYMKDE